MKTIKHFTVPMLLLAGILVFSSCTDLSVENKNAPGRDEALANPADLVSLVEGQTLQQFLDEHGATGFNIDGWADQMTSTNNVNEFWDFADQPRRRFNNRTTWTGTWIAEQDWNESNASVSTANTIIQKIEVDEEPIVLEDGTDVSGKMLAASYFLRGLARGSLGMTYDQAYLVDVDTDLSTAPDFVPYTDLIEGAVTDMDKAIAIADTVTNFAWDFLPDAASADLDLAEFKTVANSYSARFLANTPRTASESASWDWDRVLTYAEKGIGGSNAADPSMTQFTATSIAGEFYNVSADWQTVIYPPPAGYLPRDLKIFHLLDDDRSYPVDYPSTTSADGATVPDTLEESELDTSDPRIQYFSYSPSFGYLSATRSIPLFSNYVDIRNHFNNIIYDTSGLPVVYFVEAELQYIRAEANLMKSTPNKLAAKQELEASPFGTGQTDTSPDMPFVQNGLSTQDGFSAGKTILATASDEAFVDALHTEYSVELGLIDRKGLQWFFMRRHDLLQEGTPLHFPVPGSELEITQREYYTFGGPSYASEPGTATGSNSWKNSAPKASQQGSTYGVQKNSAKTYTTFDIPKEYYERLKTLGSGKKGKNN